MSRSEGADAEQRPPGESENERELAAFVEAIRSGQVDTILGTGGESKVLRLLDAKIAEENERLLCDLSRTNVELIKARDSAEAANRAKSEFLAKMSHELRTPMNSIVGFTELMMEDRRDPPNEKRARRLEKVHRNAKALLALINNLLDLSKIEADRMTLDREGVDVAALITECVESTRPLVKRDRVELRLRLAPCLTHEAEWIGDRVRLGQIVTNLLSNAAKFTDSGHIEVRAAVDNGYLAIEVEDTGIGIVKEDLQRIFDEFEQADSSSTRRAGGTGLGLSICRKLCKLMNGQIAAESTPGVGSSFTVRIPTAADATVSRHMISEQPERDTVLLAGGEAFIKRVQRIPKASANRVECAGDLKHAIGSCQEQRPAMVWIDPFWADALPLLADLRTRQLTADIRVGVLAIIDDRCASVAFDECVANPPGKNTLYRIVRNTSDVPASRALLLLKGKSEDDYVGSMLSEFADVALMEATSVEQAAALTGREHCDAVLFYLADPRPEVLEFAHRLQRGAPGTIPRLIAVLPREPTPEDSVALRMASQWLVSKQGEPIDDVVSGLFALVEKLAALEPRAAVVTTA